MRPLRGPLWPSESTLQSHSGQDHGASPEPECSGNLTRSPSPKCCQVGLESHAWKDQTHSFARVQITCSRMRLCDVLSHQHAIHLGDLAGHKAVFPTGSDPTSHCGKPEGSHGAVILSTVCLQGLVTLSHSLVMEASPLNNLGNSP